MRNLHQGAKSSKHCPPPPRFWGRYVDDTFVIHKEANKQGFLQHINSVDPAIRFTVEDNKEDGFIPFLDTIVKPEAHGSRSITVYRKPTHKDQYLQWDSHHHLSAKFSVIQTLSHRLPPCAVILSCFKKKRSTSWKLSPTVTTLNGLWTRWRKGLTGLPDRSMMGATVMTSLPTMECQVRVILSYPTHKVFVKVSKRSVVDMASKLTSKVPEPSKPSGLPQGQRPNGQPKWCHLLAPVWGPRLWWWVHRGNLQDL